MFNPNKVCIFIVQTNKDMTTITTYNGNQKDANFYIQAKGLNAGRPLRNATPNCFAVYTDVDNAFEIMYSLFTANAFKIYIIGSVIPFIRISTIKEIVLPAFDKAYNTKQLETINSIDENIEILEKKIKLMREMKFSLAHQVLKTSK